MLRYHKILVPLDGSELAERALIPTMTIAKAMNSGIVLFRSVPPPFSDMGSNFLKQSAIELNGGTETDYLQSVLSRVMAAGVNAQTRLAVWQQPVAESIIVYAKEIGADLIVMSSHGRSGIGRWMLGSVAEKVLRRTPCDTLIIRAQTQVEPFVHKRILVPLDGSPLAELALNPGVSLAAATDSELVLLRAVTSDIKALEAGDRSVLYSDIEAQERSESEAYLRHLRSSLTEVHPVLRTDVLAGIAAECIIDYADEQQVGLIVMASHGRSGISRWVYGSITEKVLHGANCATMVIRARKSKRSPLPWKRGQ